eukprot:s101_g26.t1
MTVDGESTILDRFEFLDSMSAKMKAWNCTSCQPRAQGCARLMSTTSTTHEHIPILFCRFWTRKHHCTKECRDFTLPAERVMIQMDANDATKVLATELLYLHNAEVDPVDSSKLRLTPYSLLVPSAEEDAFKFHSDSWWIEHYAGGMGGWSFASKFFQPMMMKRMTRIALESDLQYATQYTLHHQTSMVGDLLSMPIDFIMHHSSDVMILTDIRDVLWQKQVQWIYHHFWSMSAPCQSWSAASYQDGLKSVHGQSFVYSICQAKVFRPRFIGLEQVAGFSQHVQFGFMMNLLDWAGYVKVFQKVCDMADISPVKRQRWLALYVRKDAFVQTLQPQPWPKAPVSPKNFEALHVHDDFTRHAFEPSFQAASRYFSEAFMPKKRDGWTKAEIIAFRVPSLDVPLPTFMKQYGNSHNLNETLLRSNGLFGVFVRHDDSFRFFAPYEILKLHVQRDPTTLLKPASLAWGTLGNAISTPHAMYVLFHMLRMSEWISPDVSFERCIHQLIQERFTTSNTVVLEDQFAWYVGSANSTAEAQRFLHFFMQELLWTNQEEHPPWPHGFYFDPKHGRCQFDTEEDVRDPFSLTPTEPYHMTCQVALAVTPGEYGILTITPDVTWRTLLSLWGYRFMPMTLELAPEALDQYVMTMVNTGKIMLAPSKYLDYLPPMLVDRTIPKTIPLLIRQDCDLTLYEVAHGRQWSLLTKELNMQGMDLFDEYGTITPAALLKHPTFLSASDPSPGTNEHVTRLAANMLHHLTDAKFEVITPQDTDILLLYVTGTVQAMEAFSVMWLNEDQIQWSATHGRQINVQCLETGAYQILYRPKLPNTATPVSFFQKCLFVHMMKSALAVLTQPAGIDWILKYEQRVLFRGTFAPDLSMSLIIPMFEHFFQLRPLRGTPAFITMAKRCGDLCTLADLQARSRSQTFVVTMMGDPISGGGGKTNPTAKQDHEKTIEVGIANLFLEYGINITSVPDFTNALIQVAGTARLHALLFTETSTQRYASFENLCAASKLELPNAGPRYAQVNAKFQKLRAKQEAKQPQTIDVTQFALNEQFFKNSDGTQAVVLQQYTPHASGVILISAPEAEQWMQATTDLSPDELALYIVGDARIPTEFHATKIHAPARDSQGREVLLNGCLVQMGSKHIQTIQNQETIELKNVQVCAITIWQDLMDPAMWQRITQAPVRTVKELLALEGFAGVIGKPWGRTFQKDGIVVDPGLASSMQFHCEMERGTRFESLLRRSGFNHIFITPKASDGQPSQEWRIIWLAMTPKEIETKTTSILGTAGLIKGRKSIGLRVEEKAFHAAWAKLRPDDELPDQRIMTHVFKLQPLPLGLDHAILKTWAETQGWDIKPIKPLGAKQWIVSSDAMPPAVLNFNGHPLLCQKLVQKNLKPIGAIAAGPRTFRTTSSSNASTASTGPVEQLEGTLPFDPWMKYNVLKTTNQGKNRDDSKLQPNQTPYVEHRQLSGPYADMFQQQDSRIKNVETILSQLQDNQANTQKTLETQLQGVETRLAQHVAQTQAGFEHITKENHTLQCNISEALSKQEERMAGSFAELKMLFMQSRHGDRGTKRHVTDSRDDEELLEEED